MKNFPFVCVLSLIAFSAGAQTPTPPVESAGTLLIAQGTKPFPLTAHDYALSRIKEFREYQKSKGIDPDFVYRFIGGTSQGKEQSVSVIDGKIDLNNLTLEDAFLFLYSSQVDEQLTREKEWDRNEKEREERIASKPPDKMKVGPDKWDVHNQPAWSTDGTVLADTDCASKSIRILETGPGKPDSMLHEMLHAATGCSHNLELHRTIYAMTPKLLKMLQQNPDLVAYLTKPSAQPIASHDAVLPQTPKITQSYDGCNTTTYIDGVATSTTLVYCPPKPFILAPDKVAVPVELTPSHVSVSAQILAKDGTLAVMLSDDEYSHLQQLRAAVVEEEKRLAVKYGADPGQNPCAATTYAFNYPCLSIPFRAPDHYEYHWQFLLIEKAK